MDLIARPLRTSDLDAVLGLLHAYDDAFFGEPMMDAEDVLGEWQAPSFDFDRDSLGLERAPESGAGQSELVAAGSLLVNGTVEVSVAAPHWGGAWEDRLVGHLESVARERGVPEVHRYCAEADRAGQDLLAARGWSAAYTSWVLQLAPDDSIHTRPLPDGYAIRPFAAGDEHAVYEVVHDAFGEWQTHQRSFEDWAASVVRRPGGDPTRFRVATFAADPGQPPRIVGASVVFDGADEAWVAQLAVHRDHRRRGLAQQLLAESFTAARERGIAKGGLSTDTRTGALDLYQRLGMTVFCSYVCWSRTF